MHEIYAAFVNAGFSPDQAMETKNKDFDVLEKGSRRVRKIGT